VDAFPVRRVITRADFAGKGVWMTTRKIGVPDQDPGTVRVLAVHGDFYIEGRGGFPRGLYAAAHAVSFVDVSVRSLELTIATGGPGAGSQARFGFACRAYDPLYVARANVTSLFPELERYVALLLGRRVGYRNRRVGPAELQNMIFDYSAIRPPRIRGIRIRLAHVEVPAEPDVPMPTGADVPIPTDAAGSNKTESNGPGNADAQR
jgi:hypothetical protein